MNKKALNSILIVALLGIWGSITFRVVSTTSEEVIPEIEIKKSIPEKLKSQEVDFIIDASYRDPFLGKNYRTNRKPTTKKTIPKRNTKPIQPKIELPKTNWSFIVYRGIFKSEKSKFVGMVSINNNDHMIKEGIEINEVTFHKILQDSILVEYHHEKKYITRATK